MHVPKDQRGPPRSINDIDSALRLPWRCPARLLVQSRNLDVQGNLRRAEALGGG